MSRLKRTLFYDRHKALGARIVEFGGWDMPLHYPSGIVQEHLATRRGAGLFDVSHMGRFLIRGPEAVAFLQHALTNDAEALDGRPAAAQYTIIANETGGAIDDAYLMRLDANEYLLVVNAANRRTDWEHLQALATGAFQGVDLIDITEEMVMLALQGPASSGILEQVVDSGWLPEPVRNAVGVVTLCGAQVRVSRTGYTGEPLSFELFTRKENGLALWDLLVENGATPVGLGARDTLRLEAGLPLYGHEFGLDYEGKEIPVLAVPLTRFAVSFSPAKKDFVGRKALKRQFDALERILCKDLSSVSDLPRLVRPVALLGRGIARAGAGVFKGGRRAGTVTSGTMVPYWLFEGQGSSCRPTDRHEMRSICLALIDSCILVGERVNIDIRNRAVEAAVVARHLRSDTPLFALPVVLSY
jgi:aminomethyltransferase